MQRGNLIEQLKDQGTWRLFALGVLTLGIYYTHYLNRQTDRLRHYLRPDPVVSDAFLITMTALAWVSAGLTIAWLLDPSWFYKVTSHIAYSLFMLLVIIWGFRANQRLNWHYKLPPNSAYCFKGVWTVLFSPLYFNFKINQLNRMLAASSIPA